VLRPLTTRASAFGLLAEREGGRLEFYSTAGVKALRSLTEVPTRIRQVRHNNRSLLFWVSKLVLGSRLLATDVLE
jgi:hypothetical protein